MGRVFGEELTKNQGNVRRCIIVVQIQELLSHNSATLFFEEIEKFRHQTRFDSSEGPNYPPKLFALIQMKFESCQQVPELLIVDFKAHFVDVLVIN